ncbi:MAG: class I SAM-dependent methyltransferase [Chloroflexi bacterium]|nr:class I SAM-dependent methyltransferase [Chloroflexota bacterium]
MSGYSSERMARLVAMEIDHFWFRGRRELVLDLCARFLSPGDRVLDIGCGSGYFLGHLRQAGYRAYGLDRFLDGETHSSAGTGRILLADATQVPLRAGTFDAVLALDVLEHLDDAAVLAEVRRLLRPGGMLIVSVPATKWLWGYRDIDAHHLRRYSRRDLLNRLAGFEVHATQRYPFFLFPLVAASRILGRFGRWSRDREDTVSGPLNAVLYRITRTELVLARRFGIVWPSGSSLVAAARLPPEH